MPHHSNDSAIVAAEPKHENDNTLDRPRAAEVEVRHRGRMASFLSRLSCCSKSSITDSIHFHAQRVEDSVHVMIKHDKDACKKRGQPEKAYTPRVPLSERLTSAREMSHATIEAREADGESEADRDILAAVAKADCCVHGNAVQ